MFNLENVLVVVDPYAANDHVLQRVRYLQRMDDFDVHLVSADYTQYLVEGYYFDGVELERLRREYLDERKEALEQIAETLRAMGLRVTTSAHWGHPAYRVIVDAVRDTKADLVIQGGRNHSLAARIFLSHDDWQLVKHCPVPLMMVHDREMTEPPRILCPVDPFHRRSKPSGLDHQLIGIGKRLHDEAGGELYVMHSYHQPPLSGHYPAEAELQHRQALDEISEEFDVPQDRRILRADPSELAIQRVEQNFSIDIIIMGAVSRSLMLDLFIGSTTERVLDYVDADILIVKPAGATANKTQAA